MSTTARMDGPDKDQVKAAAAGRWTDILTALGGVPVDILDGHNHPCPKCGGKDRFRMIDQEAGALLCNQCFREKNGDGFAALQWLTGRSFPEIVKAVAGHLGIAADTGGNGKPADPVEIVARLKHVPVDSLRAYGARAAKRGKLAVARVPVYNEHGQQHSYFDLPPIDDEKGWCKTGKGNAGLFFPGRLPKAGETEPWCVTEGVKDAAALHGLG